MLHIKIYNCQLKDLDSIYSLSQMLAQYFPAPEQFVTGIHELLLNAVEHGNLGIGFDRKTELVRQGKWKEEIAHRLALPENAGKEVEIKLHHDEQECRLAIADQGEGFAWKNYIGLPADSSRPNGRGLWIAYNSKFDRILFNKAGNEVTCVAQYCADPVPKLRMLTTA
jgi:anti-sigma regulatory factor (Ser/Thr protein kinase)